MSTDQQRSYELQAFVAELESNKGPNGGKETQTLALEATTKGARIGVALSADEKAMISGHGISVRHALIARAKHEINTLRALGCE